MITPQQTLIFRGLKKSALVYLLLLRIGRPIGETKIASILSITPKTARERLRDLVELGLVTRIHAQNGYIVTGGGLQLIGLEELKPVKFTGLPININKEGKELNKPKTIINNETGKIFELFKKYGISQNWKTTALAERIDESDFYKALGKLGSKPVAENTGLIIRILEQIADQKDAVGDNLEDWQISQFKDWES
jgi:DNA-binding Lrp family transcriptional regulator